MSFALGVLQIITITWFVFLIIPKKFFALIISCVMLSFISLRPAGVELWYQYFFINMNIFFFISLTYYLRSRNPYFFIISFFLILLSPTLYLAGFLNVLSYSGTLLLLLILDPPKLNIRNTSIILMCTLGMTLFFIYYTWIPFFEVTPFSMIAGVQGGNYSYKIREFIFEIIMFPYTLLTYGTNLTHGKTFFNHSEYFEQNTSYRIACILLSFYHVLIIIFVSTTIKVLLNSRSQLLEKKIYKFRKILRELRSLTIEKKYLFYSYFFLFSPTHYHHF